MSAPGDREDPERLSSAWQSASSVRIVSDGAYGDRGLPYTSKSSRRRRGRRLSAGGTLAFLTFACTAISLFDLYVLASG